MIATVSPAPGAILNGRRARPIFTWPTTSGAAIFIATTATEPSPSVSTEAGVEDAGAGMSAAWFDFDNDGNQDIYVANMWSAAGQRVSEQKNFHESDPGRYSRPLPADTHAVIPCIAIRETGSFKTSATQAGVEMGRWAWSSDAWDFDHDGYSDLYIANGYISGPTLAMSPVFSGARSWAIRRRIPTRRRATNGMERHQRAGPLGLFMGWSREKRFLCQ